MQDVDVINFFLYITYITMNGNFSIINNNVVTATNKLVTDYVGTTLSDVKTCDKFIKFCLLGVPYAEYGTLISTSPTNISTFMDELVTTYKYTKFQNTLMTALANAILSNDMNAINSIFTSFNAKLLSYTTKASSTINTIAQLFYTSPISQTTLNTITSLVPNVMNGVQSLVSTYSSTNTYTTYILKQTSFLLWGSPDYETVFIETLLTNAVDWKMIVGYIDYYLLLSSYVIGTKNVHVLPKTIIPFVNIPDILTPNYTGIHRSGWQYVIDNLIDINNTSSPIILNTYIDRTFGWNYDYNSTKNIIPYTVPWVGFIHHVANSQTPNNVIDLFSKPKFLASLPTCLGLYVLSNKSMTDITSLLSSYSGTKPELVSLIHPTENPSILFNNNDYNVNKNIIQIGSWLRQLYPLCALDVPNKYVLVGQNMNDITPTLIETPQSLPTDNKSPIQIITNSMTNQLNTAMMCRKVTNDSRTRFINEAYTRAIELGGTGDLSTLSQTIYNKLVSEVKSVNVIQKLDDTEYDIKLSNTIVFLCLTDANAVNTVIECIVRNTPILVNRLPALQELLGANYPMFYTYDSKSITNTVTNAKTILSQNNIVQTTTLYMQTINKTQLTIQNFLKMMLISNVGVKMGVYYKTWQSFGNTPKFKSSIYSILNTVVKSVTINGKPIGQSTAKLTDYQTIVNSVSQIVSQQLTS